MAEKMEGMKMPSNRGKPKYDWDNWLDGSVWRLEKGVDFDASFSTMRSIANNQAKRQGMSLRTSLKDGFLYIQAIMKEQPK